MSLFDPNFVDAIALFSLLFLSGGVFFLGLILANRVVSTQRENKLAWLRDLMQRKINVLVIYENERMPQKPFQWAFHLDELRSLMDNYWHQQLMIDLLVTNRQNLTGKSSAVLRKVYLRLGLRRMSRQKLQHANHHVKIQGIQELAEMECTDALPIIHDLMHNNNRQVCEEAFMAWVQLAGKISFDEVPNYNGRISDWMQMTIHKHLSRLSANELPKFYLWLCSQNPFVRKLAINMIAEFRQLEAIPALVTLLQDNDKHIVCRAVEVLGDLGANEQCDDVAHLGKKHLLDEMISLSVAQTMTKIATGKKHIAYLGWQMVHGSHAVKKAAMQALLALHVNLLDARLDFNIDNDAELEAIYDHLTSPLLQ
jgi:hypothetical protein